LETVSKGRIKTFIGESYSSVYATEPFELLPFILLENAIKYTPNGKDIVVEFREDKKGIYVSIQNVGPYVNSNEIERLFEYRYRSVNAKLLSENNSDIEGYGLGLYIAKEICDNNNLKMSISSDKAKKFTISGIEYAYFTVELMLPISDLV